jgi:hypothetical protein
LGALWHAGIKHVPVSEVSQCREHHTVISEAKMLDGGGCEEAAAAKHTGQDTHEVHDPTNEVL